MAQCTAPGEEGEEGGDESEGIREELERDEVGRKSLQMGKDGVQVSAVGVEVERAEGWLEKKSLPRHAALMEIQEEVGKGERESGSGGGVVETALVSLEAR